MIVSEPEIFAIERPHPRLMILYLIRAVLSLPFIFVLLPLYLFRYHTLRYKFDEEGIHVRWGILFRRQINLTYARIQDIHLTSGLLQRWLGLADVNIQTASGTAGAEMTIEGLMEYEAIRDFLYTRMRGYRDHQPTAPPAHAPPAPMPEGGEEAVALLHELVDEMRRARTALDQLAANRRPPDV